MLGLAVACSSSFACALEIPEYLHLRNSLERCWFFSCAMLVLSIPFLAGDYGQSCTFLDWNHMSRGVWLLHHQPHDTTLTHWKALWKFDRFDILLLEVLPSSRPTNRNGFTRRYFLAIGWGILKIANADLTIV